ncbi:RidA family protein [Kutzneria chonburiensis]|uniref:RidA family protein n=1 Tax=Kutzneria chonburiensis TaxID=1483604 RepID=A0ABV6MR09_9PSEU|nr:RidA family protein [Kutzneria chonburiensis]
MIIEQRIAELGFALPPSPAPRGVYEPVVVHGTVAYVSGQLSRVDDTVMRGPAEMPSRLTTSAAQACVLRALSALRHSLGDLDRVSRILFLRGFVNARSDFQDHSAVLDPASTLLLDIFGDAGRHARSAIGVASLPSGGLLEVELTVALTDL